MPFEKGHSGNPLGSNTRRPFIAALTRAIAQDDGKRLRQVAERLIDLAVAGEAWAVKELADRVDGKPIQTQAFENGDGSPLLAGIQVTFVKPDESNSKG
jgi:hypothetical protein